MRNFTKVDRTCGFVLVAGHSVFQREHQNESGEGLENGIHVLKKDEMGTSEGQRLSVRLWSHARDQDEKSSMPDSANHAWRGKKRMGPSSQHP